MTSVRQLARLAGVSISTVSRVLNNEPHVRPDKRKRVLELAEIYNYKSNRFAQRAVDGNSAAIGCLIPAVSSAFYSAVLEAIEDAAFAESCHVVILQSNYRIELTCLALQKMIERHMLGILIMSGHCRTPIPAKILMEIWSHGIVPVGIDTTTTARPIDRVLTDEDTLAELAVGHLYDMGHRHIAFVSLLPLGDLDPRMLAILAAVKARGLPPARVIDLITYADDVALAIQTLLKDKHRPTAIIAGNDGIAARVMQQVARHGLRIPDDISIIGCGNMQWGTMLQPPLTTIEQNPHQMGLQAVELLFQRLASDTPLENHHPQTITVQPSLLPRASCAPAPQRIRTASRS